jgi:hypothetical protein
VTLGLTATAALSIDADTGILRVVIEPGRSVVGAVAA